MHATHTIAQSLPRSEAGFGRRVLSWLDLFAATLAVSHAWTAHRRADERTLARAGLTNELQERVMELRY